MHIIHMPRTGICLKSSHEIKENTYSIRENTKKNGRNLAIPDFVRQLIDIDRQLPFLCFLEIIYGLTQGLRLPAARPIIYSFINFCLFYVNLFIADCPWPPGDLITHASPSSLCA